MTNELWDAPVGGSKDERSGTVSGRKKLKRFEPAMEKPVNFTFDAPCMSLIVIIEYIERNRPLGTQAVTRPFFLLMRE